MRGVIGFGLGASLPLLTMLPVAAGSAITLPGPTLFARDVKPGHCPVQGKDNDVKDGPVRSCNCIHWNEKERGGPPSGDFIEELKASACQNLTSYEYGAGGAASAVTYGLRKPATESGEGLVRGMMRIEFNGNAQECSETGYRTKLGYEECRNAFDEVIASKW